VAGDIKDQLMHETLILEKKEFLTGIRNSLISNIPARIERPIKAIFKVSDEDWDNLRNQRTSGLPPHNGTEIQQTALPPTSESVLETRLGSIDSLSELLTFAFLKRFQGKNVEIEVRVKSL
jgi:hypothetical protein